MGDRAFWLPYLDSATSNLYRSPLIFPERRTFFFFWPTNVTTEEERPPRNSWFVEKSQIILEHKRTAYKKIIKMKRGNVDHSALIRKDKWKRHLPRI